MDVAAARGEDGEEGHVGERKAPVGYEVGLQPACPDRGHGDIYHGSSTGICNTASSDHAAREFHNRLIHRRHSADGRDSERHAQQRVARCAPGRARHHLRPNWVRQVVPPRSHAGGHATARWTRGHSR